MKKRLLALLVSVILFPTIASADTVDIVENFEMPTVEATEYLNSVQSCVIGYFDAFTSKQEDIKATLQIIRGNCIFESKADELTNDAFLFVRFGMDTVYSYQDYIELTYKNLFGEGTSEYNTMMGELITPYFNQIINNAESEGLAVYQVLFDALENGTISDEDADTIQEHMNSFASLVTEATASIIGAN